MKRPTLKIVIHLICCKKSAWNNSNKDEWAGLTVSCYDCNHFISVDITSLNTKWNAPNKVIILMIFWTFTIVLHNFRIKSKMVLIINISRGCYTCVASDGEGGTVCPRFWGIPRKEVPGSLIPDSFKVSYSQEASRYPLKLANACDQCKGMLRRSHITHKKPMPEYHHCYGWTPDTNAPRAGRISSVRGKVAYLFLWASHARKGGEAWDQERFTVLLVLSQDRARAGKANFEDC